MMGRKCCGLWFSLGVGIALLLISIMAHAEAEIGKPVPAFDSVLLDGSTLRGERYAGKPVLVMFWATWCPICRKELPQMEQLYQRHRTRGLEVLAVSIDAERLEIDEFLKENSYSFPVAMRSARHSEIFGVTKTPPRFFLIDRQGTLRFRHQGEIPLDRIESQLLPIL